MPVITRGSRCSAHVSCAGAVIRLPCCRMSKAVTSLPAIGTASRDWVARLPSDAGVVVWQHSA